MAEPGGTCPIQVGQTPAHPENAQASVPTSTTPGPLAAIAMAPAGVDGLDDMAVTNMSTSAHGASGGRHGNEGGGQAHAEAPTGAAGVTVEDATAWPAVHALASMAQAPAITISDTNSYVGDLPASIPTMEGHSPSAAHGNVPQHQLPPLPHLPHITPLPLLSQLPPLLMPHQIPQLQTAPHPLIASANALVQATQQLSNSFLQHPTHLANQMPQNTPQPDSLPPHVLTTSANALAHATHEFSSSLPPHLAQAHASHLSTSANALVHASQSLSHSLSHLMPSLNSAHIAFSVQAANAAQAAQHSSSTSFVGPFPFQQLHQNQNIEHEQLHQLHQVHQHHLHQYQMHQLQQNLQHQQHLQHHQTVTILGQNQAQQDSIAALQGTLIAGGVSGQMEPTTTHIPAQTQTVHASNIPEQGSDEDERMEDEEDGMSDDDDYEDMEDSDIEVPDDGIIPPASAFPEAAAAVASLESFVTVAQAAAQAATQAAFAATLPLGPMLSPLIGTNLFPLFNNLSPANNSLRQFLEGWSASTNNSTRPERNAVARQIEKTVESVSYEDLRGDRCDMQGLDWSAMGVTRKQARDHRERTFRNYVSVKGSDKLEAKPGEKVPWNSESFFRFRRMHVKSTVHLAHFQLRNLMASNSRTSAFYARCRGVVHKINTITGTESVAMRFSDHTDVQISTIAADKGVLVAGGFAGEYCIADLNSEDVGEHVGSTRAEGTVTKHASGISNHIQIHSLRNASGPLAAFASNDLGLRILDLSVGKVLSAMQFPAPVNCTAISPDQRLRAVVGDSPHVYIIAAEPERSTVSRNGHMQPEVLACLEGHKDFGFACAWAPDGYTLATGNQDRMIKIWDARKWSNAQGESTPVTTLYTEMAGVRSLQFSPAGSGKRVLVAAEEADFVSVIDAQSFRTSQTLDIFGEIAGVSMAASGQDLFVLCADKTRGGLLHFERCDTELTLAPGARATGRNGALEMRRQGAGALDWPGHAEMNGKPRRARQQATRMRLRAAAVRGMEPF